MPAPASGHGSAIPTPSSSGNPSASVVPPAYSFDDKTMTWITTGATQAPASSAATPPMKNASERLPRFD